MPINFGGFVGGGGGTTVIESSALTVATRSDNSHPAVFTNFAALEAYTATSDGTSDAASINVTSAENARQVFAVGTLNSNNQVTDVTAAYIRLNTAWVAVATNLVGTPGADGTGVDLSGFTDGQVPMVQSGNLAVSSIQQNTDGSIDIDALTRYERDSIQLGDQGFQEAYGALIKFRSLITNRNGIYNFSYYDTTSGSEKAVRVNLAAEDTLSNGVVATEDLPLTGSFTRTPSAIEAINELVFTSTPNTVLQGVRFTVTAQGQSEPYFYYPTRADWEAGTGEDLTADGSGNVTVNVSNSPLVAFDIIPVTVAYVVDSGVIRGTGSEPTFSVGRNVITLTTLADEDDIADAIINGTHTGITATAGTEINGVRTVNLTVTGTTPPAQATVTSFSVQGQSVVVDAGTDIGGVKTFNYSVENSNLVTAGAISFTPPGGSTTTIVNNVDPAGTSATGTVTSTTLTAGQSGVYTISFPVTAGGTIERTFTVRARTPAETLYYGTMATNTLQPHVKVDQE